MTLLRLSSDLSSVRNLHRTADGMPTDSGVVRFKFAICFFSCMDGLELKKECADDECHACKGAPCESFSKGDDADQRTDNGFDGSGNGGC